MGIYINGIGNISPQNTLDNSVFLDEVVETKEDFIKSIEPNYREYIEPKQSRRMSRILKMSNVAAQLCLKDANLDKPDAINVETGLGCMTDTEKFIGKIIENHETLLTPTSFIQSTHNTIGGQIALMIKANCHNFTYAQGSQSFENALLDSIMLINDGDAKTVLLGAADEITETTHKIKENLNLWKKDKVNNLDLLKSKKGTIEGEGATFFVLDNAKTENTYAEVLSVSTMFKPDNKSEVEANLDRFLTSNNLKVEDIDLVISGYNGDPKNDKIYDEITNGILKDCSHAYYKHLCGEYLTSSSFAFWLAGMVLKNQQTPDVISISNNKKKSIDKILIYNQSCNKNHSFILLSK